MIKYNQFKTFCVKITRKNFKKLTKTDINYFSNILQPSSIISENLDSYNEDWIRKYKGNSELVLKPKTTEEISQILYYCNEKNIAVVTQSGNTGLVGGSVPVFDEIIINMSKMNKILNYDSNTKLIHCEAGCILQNLNEYLIKYDRVMPIDLGAKGSCMIGGNLATNAGGIHFIKYGSLRNNCKSLKVILPNGEVLTLNENKLSLQNIFIGSEGTLGIITELEMNTAELDKFKSLCVIKFQNFEQVVECYLKTKEKFKQNLNAIEFFDEFSIRMIYDRLNKNKLFPNSENKNNFYVLIQNTSRNSREEAFDKMTEFLEENDYDSIVSDDINKQNELWAYRELIAYACSKSGVVFKYDVSLNLKEFYKLVEDIRKRIGNLAITVGYGHIGDYNLHLNVCYDKFIHDETYYEIENILEPYIFDYLKSVNGSISAEHGVGIAKAKYLNRTQTDENIKLMKRIKNSLDSKGIMNPYKLLI